MAQRSDHGKPDIEWELLVEDAMVEAERRLADNTEKARKRAIQLAREQAYHRLAIAIDRPQSGARAKGEGQLTLFPVDLTLFED